MNSHDKLSRLKSILNEMGTVVVAYSGSVSIDLEGYRQGSLNEQVNVEH